MAKKGTTNMATDSTETKPKRARATGPRTPSPLYIFATVIDGKIGVAATFRDPRKMASRFSDGTSAANGEQLLVVTPEA